MIIYDSFKRAGELHREDGPACIVYYEDGTIYCEQYCINGMFHREVGPAFIKYGVNVRPMHESCYRNGLRTNP
jgi:hypothetical protein